MYSITREALPAQMVSALVSIYSEQAKLYGAAAQRAGSAGHCDARARSACAAAAGERRAGSPKYVMYPPLQVNMNQ